MPRNGIGLDMGQGHFPLQPPVTIIVTEHHAIRTLPKQDQ